MHSPSGAEITPEGSLYTGFGELVFFVGMDREPVAQRIRTLEKGYLPIVSYEVEHDKLRYRFTFFAASLGPEQTGEDVVNFVRVTVRNPTNEPRSGFLTTAWRYQGNQTTTFHAGDNRFRRPVVGNRVGDYQQPGEFFRPDSVYAVRGNAYLRDQEGNLLFSASGSNVPLSVATGTTTTERKRRKRPRRLCRQLRWRRQSIEVDSSRSRARSGFQGAPASGSRRRPQASGHRSGEIRRAKSQGRGILGCHSGQGNEDRDPGRESKSSLQNQPRKRLDVAEQNRQRLRADHQSASIPWLLSARLSGFRSHVRHLRLPGHRPPSREFLRHQTAGRRQFPLPARPIRRMGRGSLDLWRTLPHDPRQSICRRSLSPRAASRRVAAKMQSPPIRCTSCRQPTFATTNISAVI